jgi:O-antigen/teichoic acid export membrane protein
MLAISVSQLALARADVLIVGTMLDAHSVGIYSVANQFATLVTFAISTTNAVTAPTVSGAFASGDMVRLQHAVRVTSRLSLAFTIPASIVLVCFGRVFLGWFGAEFVDAYYALIILMGGQLVIALCGPVGFLLTMTTYQRAALKIVATTALLQVALIVILSFKFGILGAAAGASVGNAARSLILSWVVRTKLGISATAF